MIRLGTTEAQAKLIGKAPTVVGFRVLFVVSDHNRRTGRSDRDSDGELLGPGQHFTRFMSTWRKWGSCAATVSCGPPKGPTPKRRNVEYLMELHRVEIAFHKQCGEGGDDERILDAIHGHRP